MSHPKRSAQPRQRGPIGRKMKPIPPMPEVFPRRPYDEDYPDGYLEGFRCYAANNCKAVEWFLENADAIRAALNLTPAKRRGKK